MEVAIVAALVVAAAVVRTQFLTRGRIDKWKITTKVRAPKERKRKEKRGEKEKEKKVGAKRKGEREKVTSFTWPKGRDSKCVALQGKRERYYD